MFLNRRSMWNALNPNDRRSHFERRPPTAYPAEAEDDMMKVQDMKSERSA